MPSVFISYAHTDKAFAESLRDKLRACGVSVWLDETHIRVGDSIITAIADGVKAVDFFVVILSPHSVSSSWVVDEINLAMACKIPVLPLMLHECDPPGFLKSRLYLSFVDASKHEEMFQRLLVRIGVPVTKAVSSVNELLELHREFLALSSGILYVTSILNVVVAISLLVGLFRLSILFAGVIHQLCVFIGIEPPEWLYTVALMVGGILAFLIVAWLTALYNRAYPSLRDWERRVYRHLYLAPRLARIASSRGIDKLLAIQAYESSNGTLGIEVFSQKFDAARSRNQNVQTN
jgi:hypothetical protein